MQKQEKCASFARKTRLAMEKKILIGDYSQNISLLHVGDEKLRDLNYCSPMSFIMFRLVGTPLSSKKPKSFACTKADSAKCLRSVLSCLLDYLDKLGFLTPIPNNQDLTTELVPSNTIAICLELNLIHDNGGR